MASISLLKADANVVFHGYLIKYVHLLFCVKIETLIIISTSIILT